MSAKDLSMSETAPFTTLDSGKRKLYPSGMNRDITTGKPRYDLIPLPMLKRLAELYARGADKYGDRNWELANSPEEITHFKAAAWRHFAQYMDGDTSEDHLIAAVWNLFALGTLQ